MDTVAIIDGFFFQRPPLRHKEVLYAIERGATVWGAASMGALRAAELERYGMRGIGHVFRWYRAGAINGDDEVAVLHAAGEFGYRVQAEALVNVRATVSVARREHMLTLSESRMIISAAKGLPFTERTYPAIVDAAADRGLNAASLQGFMAAIPHLSVDIKRRDAESLLRRLGDELDHGSGAAGAIPSTVYLDNWIEEEATVVSEMGEFRELAPLTFAQTIANDFAEWRYRPALVQWLWLSGAAQPPDPTDIEALRSMLGGCDERWLNERFLESGELDQQLGVYASVCRLMGTSLTLEPTIESLEDAVARTAALQGLLDDEGLRSLDTRRWLTEAERLQLTTPRRIATILLRSVRKGFRSTYRRWFVSQLKLDGLFPRCLIGIAESERARVASPVDSDVAARDLVNLFLKRWDYGDDALIRIADRGFVDLPDVYETAMPHYRLAATGGYDDFSLVKR